MKNRLNWYRVSPPYTIFTGSHRGKTEWLVDKKMEEMRDNIKEAWEEFYEKFPIPDIPSFYSKKQYPAVTAEYIEKKNKIANDRFAKLISVIEKGMDHIASVEYDKKFVEMVNSLIHDETEFTTA